MRILVTAIVTLVVGAFVLPLVLHALMKDTLEADNQSEGTAAAPARAAIGESAPPLKVAKWVKNGPVTIGPGKTYLIEFWGTYCPPCRESIPVMTMLQNKYRGRGLVVVGISCEQTATVSAFVKGAGKAMDYAVAVDNRRACWTAYMQATGNEYIPHAFIIDKEGKLEWHGPVGPSLEDLVLRSL